MVIIATLGYLLIPNLSKNKGVPNAANQLEGWVRLGKGQALRDGQPRGLRFILLTDPNDTRYEVDPNNPNRPKPKVVALQWIEQPEPLAPRGALQRAFITTINPNAPNGPPPYPNPLPSFVDLVLVDPMTGQPVAPANWDDPTNPQISVGDFFELSGNPNVVARITQIGPSASFPGLPRVRLTLDRSIPGTDISPLLLADGFRIIRSPRPLAGEPMLQMHRDVYIDLLNSYPCPELWRDAANNPVPNALPPTGAPYGNTFTGYGQWSASDVQGQYYDILFNSSGQVAGAPTGQFILCVRHVDRAEQILVVIYTRTGRVSAVDWNDIPGGDPYIFARDGRAAGL
jgi:hypothetical protein